MCINFDVLVTKTIKIFECLFNSRNVQLLMRGNVPPSVSNNATQVINLKIFGATYLQDQTI